MGQEDHYPKSVTYTYNLMLHFKDNEGQAHQNCTISANRTTHMTFNQHEKGGNDSEGTRCDRKDIICYKCNRYFHYADQCGLTDDEARKSREANPEARDQDRVKRTAKEVTLMHVGGTK